MRIRAGFAALGIGLSIVTLSLAASTRFISTWRNPLAGPISKPGQKVAAFVITAEESMRMGPEESLAEVMRNRGVDCVAGYTVLPGELARDKEKAREFLAKAGITGVILMRVVGENERKKADAAGAVWYSSSFYSGFWSYWDYSWQVVYSPGYLSSEKVFSIETLVYSVEKDQLIWGGLSETTTPEDVPKFLKDVVEAAAKQMRNAGLLAE